jgi:hypothetical protein
MGMKPASICHPAMLQQPTTEAENSTKVWLVKRALTNQAMNWQAAGEHSQSRNQLTPQFSHSMINHGHSLEGRSDEWGV